MEAPKNAQYELDTGEVVVRAGGRANINVQPRAAFRPCELSVRSVFVRRSCDQLSGLESVNSFTVDEVQVGRESLFRDLRAPQDRDRVHDEQVLLLRGTEVATPSSFVTISVTNHDTVDRVFRAVVSGPQQEDAHGETA